MKPYFEEKGITLYQADCLEAMRLIPDASIDACITDPPYGTTACSWDSVIPFAPMWVELKRIVKKNGAIVLFGSQPFTSALVMSNPQMFKYCWVWHKNMTASMMLADLQPLRYHEDICLFYIDQPTFNDQRAPRKESAKSRVVSGISSGAHKAQRWSVASNLGAQFYDVETVNAKSVLEFECVANGGGHKMHEAQKPVDLLRYLVRTYTNEGDTVLDFTCGSGTTGVACVVEKRSAVLIERDAHYCEVSAARIKRAQGVACDIPKRVKQYAPTPLFEAVA